MPYTVATEVIQSTVSFTTLHFGVEESKLPQSSYASMPLMDLMQSKHCFPVTFGVSNEPELQLNMRKSLGNHREGVAAVTSSCEIPEIEIK